MALEQANISKKLPCNRKPLVLYSIFLSDKGEACAIEFDIYNDKTGE
ncbi:hypothetical protein GPSY_3367 [Paraglaciecola psychrophila 170]|nr:hypothetical protein GPSY_3367 [Paraglaciecola psychrophila 170]